MLRVNFSKQAENFLLKVSAKHAQQISKKVVELQSNYENQSATLRGHAPFYRARSGEYRIIFWVEYPILYITLIGKRNDDEVYKRIRRFLS